MAKAIANFVGFVDGRQVAVQEGAELPDGDPIVRTHGDMFGKTPTKKRATSTPKRTTAKRTTKTKR